MSIRERGIHRSFTSGEVSYLMRCRTDLEQVREGSYTVKNLINLVQGPVSTRPGFEFIADISDLAGYADDENFATFSDGSPAIRLIPFVFSETQSYILIFYQDALGNKEVMFASAGGIVTSGGVPVVLSLSGTFDIQNFDYAQYNDVLFIAQPDRQPTEIIRNSHTSWTFQNQTITSMPSDWNGTDGYPERVSLYEQRVVYACTSARPSTLWFSKSGYPYDFGVSSPQVVSDAVTYTIGAGKKDKILWLVSQKKLLAGTLNSEHAISGAGGEPISYLSVSAVKHTSVGSLPVKPVATAADMYFVDKLGKRVHKYRYAYEVDGYRNIDLNALNPRGLRTAIKSWAYQETPNQTIWMRLASGALRSLVVAEEHGVIAWQTHDTAGRDSGNDYVVELESIPGTSDDTEVWLITSREKQVSGYAAKQYIYLEKISDVEISNNIEDYYLQDCFYSETNVAGISTVDVAYLSGRTINVVCDGAVFPDYYVDPTDPEIDFASDEWAALRGTATQNPTTVCVGIPYDCALAPIPLDTEKVTGGSIGSEGRLVGVIFHLYQTASGIKLQVNDADDGHRVDEVPLRSLYDDNGEEASLLSNSVRVPAPSNISNNVRYTILLDNAVPMTVLGMTDILEYKRER